jgi:hypothetical protein
MSESATQLAQTSETWSREMAPVAEWFVKELCSEMLDMSKLRRPGTRLTQERRRVAVAQPSLIFQPHAPNKTSVKIAVL